jgi:hypothetical protein
MSALPLDMLYDIFKRQEEFMDLLRKHDLMVEWPVDLTTKSGQRLIKETVFNLDGELHEAMMTLKNKMHRISDVKELDFRHYKEELGDALAFFVEVCVLSGISANDLYEEFCLKNAVVKKRLASGY